MIRWNVLTLSSGPFESQQLDVLLLVAASRQWHYLFLSNILSAYIFLNIHTYNVLTKVIQHTDRRYRLWIGHTAISWLVCSNTSVWCGEIISKWQNTILLRNGCKYSVTNTILNINTYYYTLNEVVYTMYWQKMWLQMLDTGFFYVLELADRLHTKLVKASCYD